MSKKYEELDFTDDFFFCKILMKNQRLCKELLELILKIKISKIVFSAKQKPIEITADGKGVRLDVYVEDDAKTVYDIEMQPTSRINVANALAFSSVMKPPKYLSMPLGLQTISPKK